MADPPPLRLPLVDDPADVAPGCTTSPTAPKPSPTCSANTPHPHPRPEATAPRAGCRLPLCGPGTGSKIAPGVSYTSTGSTRRPAAPDPPGEEPTGDRDG